MPNASGSDAIDHLLGLVAERRDPEALSAIYGATKARLFATALLIVRERDRAEDVLQKAYAQVWSQASAYRPASGSALDWMIGITRNLALQEIRSHHGDPDPELSAAMALPALPTEAQRPEGPAAGTAEQARALSAFAALSAPRRDLIVAAYLLGESKQRLATRSGVASEIVGGWLRGALLEVDAACRDIPAGTRQ